MGKTIDIKLSSRYDGKGVESAKRQLNDFANAFPKIGEAVGSAHSNLAKFVKEFMVGGVWGAAAELVSFAFKAIKDIWKSSEEAAKKTAEEERKAFDGRVKAIGEYQSAIEKCHAASVAAADARLKQITAEIDATKDLQKAELELERERRRAAGGCAGMAKAESGLDALDAEASAAKMAAEIAAAERRAVAAQVAEGHPLGQAPRVSNNEREKEFRNEFSFHDGSQSPAQESCQSVIIREIRGFKTPMGYVSRLLSTNQHESLEFFQCFRYSCEFAKISG